MIAIDADRDGWSDLIVASMYWPLQDEDIPLFVLLNEGGTDLSLGANALLGASAPGTTHPRIIVSADFNGDGIPDIFIGDHGYDAIPFPGHTNVLLLGKAGGGYQNASSRLPTAPDFTHSAAAGDIDGDGDVDLFVNNLNSPAAYFLLNDGNANFEQSRLGLPDEFAYGSFSCASVLFDADGDADPDLFMGTGANNWGASILLTNDGSGNFAPSASQVPKGLYGAEETIVLDAKQLDFDRDGRNDVLLVESDYDPFYVGARLQVLLSDGTGGLMDHTGEFIFGQPATTGWIKYANLADLNNDGAPDLIGEVVGGDRTVVFYINDGRNHFYLSPKALVEAGGGISEVVDFNRDGWLDVVQVATSDSKHWVRLNLRKPPPATIIGDDSGDTILGGSTANTLKGNGGADLLSGAGGKDVLEGGNGKDTLLGGASADKLEGGSGKDLLNGGAGRDTFRFIQSAGATNADRVFDFKSGEDRIFLDRGKFAIGESLSAKEFVSGTDAVATDKSDRIIYETDTGRLLYDADGSRGAHTPQLIATLSGSPVLSLSDFI
jgi:Ca2+-binding RTX toxin-like protein